MDLDQLKGPGAWDSYNEPISSSRADRTSDSSQNDTDVQSNQENGEEEN
jgi:hypothetical protein